MTPWFASPPGRYLLAWEQAQLERAVADVFGFHALQLGHPVLDGLGANRMRHRWLAFDAAHARAWQAWEASAEAAAPAVVPAAGRAAAPAEAGDDPGPPFRRTAHLLCDFDALPFPADSLDLVVMPHTLDLGRDPHQTLGEVHRVLVAEGRVVILGFNPLSTWGMRQGAGELRRRLGSKASGYVPGIHEGITLRRLRDWLRLLGLEEQATRFGAWRPPLRSEIGLARMAWLDRLGPRTVPALGAVYMVEAVKRVRGMRLVGLARERAPAARATPVVAAQRLKP